MLRPGGRLAVISFHSLEDGSSSSSCASASAAASARPGSRSACAGTSPELRSLNRKPVRPSDREVARNPRAASARLRVAVKT